MTIRQREHAAELASALRYAMMRAQGQHDHAEWVRKQREARRAECAECPPYCCVDDECALPAFDATLVLPTVPR